MATSGSTDFAATRDNIIQEALELLGVLGEGDTPSAAQLTSCARTLNSMIKMWVADGAMFWLETTDNFTIVPATLSYTMGSGGTGLTVRPNRIKQAWTQDENGADFPVEIIEKKEYFELSTKTQEGRPLKIFYDPQTPVATLYVWPNGTTSEDYELYLRYDRQIEDYDAANNDSDFPQEWFMALAYNLAFNLIPKYGTDRDRVNTISLLAAKYYEDARTQDGNSASFFVYPDYG